MAKTFGRTQLLRKLGLVMCLFSAGTCLNAPSAHEMPVTPLTSEQVVQRMAQRNEQRAQALESYRGTRTYQLEYHGLSNKGAALVVEMTYRRPNEKEFCVVSESGSELLHKRVLKRLLEAEVEAVKDEQRRQTAMHPENYEFQLLGYERTGVQDVYVLQVLPRSKNKHLFRGRIWVDGQDFAVVRMEGEPAKNPSWWTRRNAIVLTYTKVGDFWLPARNETSTQVRFAGRSLLTIDYQDYEILPMRATAITAASRNRLVCPAEPITLSAARP